MIVLRYDGPAGFRQDPPENTRNLKRATAIFWRPILAPYTFTSAHFYGKLRSVAERRRAKDAVIAEQTGPAYPSGMYPASFTPQ